MRFIDQFSVLLLDMNGTFAFGEDRFGPEEDFYETYHAFGGRRLAADRVDAIIRACCAGLRRDYDDAAKQDEFPALADALRAYGGADAEDVPLLERVFAAHELGQVPPAHAEFLRQVAKTHTLGVVSNICARPDLIAGALEAAGVRSLFTCTVFSSEGRSIKPSAALFRRALAAFPPDARVLFVGDNLVRDIHPARALGLTTVWVAPPGSPTAEADVVVESILDLADIVDKV